LKPGVNAMPEEIKIEITYNPMNGDIKINSTAENKVVMYGVLEAAKDAIQEQFMGGKSGIVVPQIVLPPIRRNGG